MSFKIKDIIVKKTMTADEFCMSLDRYSLVYDFIQKAMDTHEGLTFHQIDFYPEDKSIKVTFIMETYRKYLSIPLGYSWDSIDHAMEHVDQAYVTMRAIDNEHR